MKTAKAGGHCTHLAALLGPARAHLGKGPVNGAVRSGVGCNVGAQQVVLLRGEGGVSWKGGRGGWEGGPSAEVAAAP